MASARVQSKEGEAKGRESKIPFTWPLVPILSGNPVEFCILKARSEATYRLVCAEENCSLTRLVLWTDRPLPEGEIIAHPLPSVEDPERHVPNEAEGERMSSARRPKTGEGLCPQPFFAPVGSLAPAATGKPLTHPVRSATIQQV